MENKSKDLQIALQAATIGARKALEYFETSINFESKEDGSIVSDADRAVEKAILDYILSQDKEAQFLAEESGGEKNADRLWIVDPIDGTRPFSRGIPFWSVLISLWENGDVKLAVCFFPTIPNGLYYAERGKGAFCGEKKMHVSQISDISQASLMLGSLKRFESAGQYERLVHATNSTRAYDPTYGSCLVAEGKMDILIDSYGYPWDSAPFKVIVEEAGGKITFLNGNRWDLSGRGAVITNGKLHDKVLALYNA